MNTLRDNSCFALLETALAEADSKKRFTLLNMAANAFAASSSDVQKSFAAVCYTINGEPVAGENIPGACGNIPETEENCFAASCIAMLKGNYPSAKMLLQKAADGLVAEKNFTELGILLKLHKHLAELKSAPIREYPDDITLPPIVVFKVYTPDIVCDLPTGLEEACIAWAEAENSAQPAAVVCSCSNIIECKMLEIFAAGGAKILHAPLAPAVKLAAAYPPEISTVITAAAEKYSGLPAITDDLATAFPGENLWRLLSEYSAKSLLGIAALYAEDTQLPVKYIYAAAPGTAADDTSINLCKLNGFRVKEIGE